MVLVDDGVLSLGDPVERFLPELADRRVLRTLQSALDDTVPAERPITIEDLLTFRMGFGNIMEPGTTRSWPPRSSSVSGRSGRRGRFRRSGRTSGSPGSPRCRSWSSPARCGATTRGRRCSGSCSSGRAGDRSNSSCGRACSSHWACCDTSFSVPPEKQDRFTTAYIPNLETGGLDLLDEPGTGSWSAPPAMANVAGMLVATLDDSGPSSRCCWPAGGTTASPAVARLRAGHDPQPCDAPTSAPGHRSSRPGQGWGYGMAAPPDDGSTPPVPSGFGWNGGLGTVWRTDPARGPHRHHVHVAGHELARATAPLRRLLGRRLRRAGRLRRVPRRRDGRTATLNLPAPERGDLPCTKCSWSAPTAPTPLTGRSRRRPTSHAPGGRSCTSSRPCCAALDVGERRRRPAHRWSTRVRVRHCSRRRPATWGSRR